MAKGGRKGVLDSSPSSLPSPSSHEALATAHSLLTPPQVIALRWLCHGYSSSPLHSSPPLPEDNSGGEAGL